MDEKVSLGAIRYSQGQKMSKSLGNLITPSQLLGSAVSSSNSKESPQNSRGTPSNSKESQSNSKEIQSNSKESQSNSKGSPQNSKKGSSNSKKAPTSLLEKSWPVDVLRLWVASSDFTYDISLGLQQLLKVRFSF